LKNPPLAKETTDVIGWKNRACGAAKKSQTEAREDDRIYGQERNHHAERAGNVEQGGVKAYRTRPRHGVEVLE
jgi:hypothetical protein